MFTRELQAQISAYFGTFQSNYVRAVNMAKGLILLIQTILQALDIIKGLWDNGFGATIDALENPTDNEKISGNSKRWWKTAQVVFLIYFVTMDIPLEAFYNLSLTDAEGNTIYPYRLFDPTTLIPGLTIRKFAWTEPEIGVPETPVIPDIPVEPIVPEEPI